jgi:hypothetical protein
MKVNGTFMKYGVSGLLHALAILSGRTELSEPLRQEAGCSDYVPSYGLPSQVAAK